MMLKSSNRRQVKISDVAFSKSDFEDAAEYLLLVDESNFKYDITRFWFIKS